MFCQQHTAGPESRPPHLHERCSKLHAPLSISEPKAFRKRLPGERKHSLLSLLVADRKSFAIYMVPFPYLISLQPGRQTGQEFSFPFLQGRRMVGGGLLSQPLIT